jgi:hypothetical protein
MPRRRDDDYLFDDMRDEFVRDAARAESIRDLRRFRLADATEYGAVGEFASSGADFDELEGGEL